MEIKKNNYIIVHGTNGEGYSDTTVRKVKSFDEALSYASDVFENRETRVEFNGAKPIIRTEYCTDKEDNTERVSIFEVPKNKPALVKAEALLTAYEIVVFDTIEEASKELQLFAKIITEPDEDSMEAMVFGDGEDGYYHFEIV